MGAVWRADPATAGLHPTPHPTASDPGGGFQEANSTWDVSGSAGEQRAEAATVSQRDCGLLLPQRPDGTGSHASDHSGLPLFSRKVSPHPRFHKTNKPMNEVYPPAFPMKTFLHSASFLPPPYRNHICDSKGGKEVEIRRAGSAGPPRAPGRLPTPAALGKALCGRGDTRPAAAGAGQGALDSPGHSCGPSRGRRPGGKRVWQSHRIPVPGD